MVVKWWAGSHGGKGYAGAQDLRPLLYWSSPSPHYLSLLSLTCDGGCVCVGGFGPFGNGGGVVVCCYT